MIPRRLQHASDRGDEVPPSIDPRQPRAIAERLRRDALIALVRRRLGVTLPFDVIESALSDGRGVDTALVNLAQHVARAKSEALARQAAARRAARDAALLASSPGPTRVLADLHEETALGGITPSPRHASATVADEPVRTRPVNGPALRRQTLHIAGATTPRLAQGAKAVGLLALLPPAILLVITLARGELRPVLIVIALAVGIPGLLAAITVAGWGWRGMHEAPRGAAVRALMTMAVLLATHTLRWLIERADSVWVGRPDALVSGSWHWALLSSVLTHRTVTLLGIILVTLGWWQDLKQGPRSQA